MRAPAVLDDCVITFSVADLKQVNFHKATGPGGLPVLRACSKTFRQVNITSMRTQSMSWPAGKCLHWYFLPDPVCSAYMVQADHHSPCVQERQGNLSKLLLPHNTHIYSHEMLWKAGRSISPQHIHRWCNLYCTPHYPFPPGQKEHICDNAIHWLQHCCKLWGITNRDEALPAVNSICNTQPWWMWL